MIEEVRDLMDKYIYWLREKTSLREINDWVEITTPYLDRHNDYLQLYVQPNNGGYLLSDAGYIIDDLKLSGCDLNTPKRVELLNQTLNGFGVKKDNDDSLIAQSSSDDFQLKKHNLIQAMLAVNDLFYLATPLITSLFLEDVAAWMDLNEIRYIPKVKFAGRSGYDHLFDFVIPKSRSAPERILKAINRPSRDTAQAFSFAWIDTREVRPPDSKAYALLNDTAVFPSSAVFSALKNYNVVPVNWSQREQHIEQLAV